MVNTGQPSTACLQCRSRRIKCDAARPQCERCIKYGVVCPGYPARNLLTFRDDTDRVRERAYKKYEKNRKIQRGPSSRAVTGVIEFSSDPSENSSTSKVYSSSQRNEKALARAHAQRTGRPTQSSKPALVQGAIAAFLSQWNIPDPDVFWGAFDCASDLYLRASPNGCFRASLEAVALLLMSLPKDQQKFDIRRAAMRSYGNALVAINEALDDPTQRLHDHTFMAVFLVCMFETFTELPDKAERIVKHLLGLMTMVRLRGPSQFDHSEGRRLFLISAFIWNIGAIALPRPILPPLPKDICNVLLEHPLGKHEKTYRLLPIVQHGVELRGTALESLRSRDPPLDATGLQSLLSSISILEAELYAWYDSLPPNWARRDHVYQLLTINIYRAHLLFLQDLRIRCYRRLMPFTSESYIMEIASCVAMTRALVDEMCSVMPYSFADDDPRARTATSPTKSPQSPQGLDVDIIYHMSFSFPLLISSMVEALPSKQREGISRARYACARSCGLERPFRTYPQVLVQPPPLGGDGMPELQNHYFATEQQDKQLLRWAEYADNIAKGMW